MKQDNMTEKNGKNYTDIIEKIADKLGAWLLINRKSVV